MTQIAVAPGYSVDVDDGADGIQFTVRGLPLPQGNAKAFAVKTKTGKVRAILATGVKEGTPLGTWRGAIASAAAEVMGSAPAWSGPVNVAVWFVFPRPASHFLPANGRRVTAEVRLDAPYSHTSKPDVDKLSRALLDGITNVVVRDDSQVAGLQAWKVYEDDERRPGCIVWIRRLAVTR